MNLFNIIDEIEKIDPEVHERLNPRRAAMKGFGSFGAKIALSAMPIAIASMFKKAYGQQTNAVVGDVLNFALTLEYLEAEFYTQGTNATRSALFTAQGQTTAATSALARITADENAHVNFLRTALTGLGITPVAKGTYDFTGKGNFSTVFTNYDTFLGVAQTFEDTGVRAYKGQAPALLGNKTYLTAALGIHSVEARHASHLRQMRRGRGGAAANLKPYITGANDTGLGAAVNNSFTGEDNLIQGGVNITTLNGVSGTVSVNVATESFDEPLTKAQVLTAVTPFFA